MGLFGFGRKKTKAEPEAEPVAAPRLEPAAVPLSVEDARAALQAALKTPPPTIAALTKAEGALAAFRSAGPSKLELGAFEKQVAKLRKAAHRLDPDTIVKELEAAQESSDTAALTALLPRAKSAKLDHLIELIEETIKELEPVPKKQKATAGNLASSTPETIPSSQLPQPQNIVPLTLKIPELTGEANNWEAWTERCAQGAHCVPLPPRTFARADALVSTPMAVRSDTKHMPSSRVASYRTWKAKAAIARRELCVELLAPVVAKVSLTNIAARMIDSGIQAPADIVSVNTIHLARHLALTSEQATELYYAGKTSAEDQAHECAPPPRA